MVKAFGGMSCQAGRVVKKRGTLTVPVITYLYPHGASLLACCVNLYGVT